ncbi:MAG: glycosyltransferase [Armatimonadota bacterium]|nr:glycosyltransferase [Armatimonadota bacterium]
MKVLHLITGLGTGGAEMMLYKVLSHMDPETFQNQVVSMTDCGQIGQRIEALNIPVTALGMSPGVPSPQAILKLVGHIRRTRPDVVQTWMYHSDLLGGLAGRLAGGVPVLWNIRNSGLEPNLTKQSTLRVAGLCMRLSRKLPTRIVCCSERAARFHADFGYPEEKMVVIPNGFTLDAFQPDPSARPKVRRELGLPEETPLIGKMARFDPTKDHSNFIQAAGLLHKINPNVHFLLCGKGMSEDNSVITDEIEAVGITDNCHLLGLRKDVAALTAALDIATSSSAGEGFSNAMGEAMACAIPCAVTDVGDSAMLVGDTGRIVPRRDSEALANAWREMLDMSEEDRRRLGALARQRVETHFDIKEIALNYQKLYQETMTTCAA